MDKIVISTPTVTVFMAVFNGGKYIKEAIKSILTQNFTDFELLIVNDGSTDNTLDIIAEFNDPRIRLLHNEGNKGLTYTRNRGLREAKGKYFAVLDSDDIAMPSRLKIQVTFMNANPDIAICGGQAIFIDANSKEIKGYEVPVSNNLSHQLVLHNIFINSTLMIKTAVMKELGGYREMSPAEDYDLSFRIALKHQVANLSDKLVAYREHGNNTSKIQIDKLNNALGRIIEHIHLSLNIPIDNYNIKIHQNVLNFDVKSTDLSEFERLLTILRASNNLNNIYPTTIFNKFLFETWFKLLREKKAKNIILLYFKNPFFERSFITAKQLRKIIKQAFFLNLPFYKKY